MFLDLVVIKSIHTKFEKLSQYIQNHSKKVKTVKLSLYRERGKRKKRKIIIIKEISVVNSVLAGYIYNLVFVSFTFVKN